MNKFKKIEKEVRDSLVADRYRATCESVFHAELGIQFLNTEEGKNLNGSEMAKEQILKYEELLRIKKAEKSFMESLL